MEIILTLPGHKGNVNFVDCHPIDAKLFLSWLFILNIKNIIIKTNIIFF
jgi:hypothetical protein